MTKRRDSRHRSQRYDGALAQREFARWVIRATRALALPTVVLSLLLVVDAFLPGSAEEGLVYRRMPDTRWLSPGGYQVSVGWPARPDCLERVGGSGPLRLYTTRPQCSGHVGVSTAFGRQLMRGDTLRIERTPIYGQIRAVARPSSGDRDHWYPLYGIGFYVCIGLLPLLSFGSGFAKHPPGRNGPRYHLSYVVPVVAAEAFYIWFVVQAFGGG